MDNIRKGKPIKRTRRRKLRDLGDLDGLFQTFITIKTAEGKAKRKERYNSIAIIINLLLRFLTNSIYLVLLRLLIEIQYDTT